MTEVIVAHEKHGTFTYSSALVLLKQRVDDGWWYYDNDLQRAKALVAAGDEENAWRFLESRSDHEYEMVEKQVVR
jgi:hypothetical protein